MGVKGVLRRVSESRKDGPWRPDRGMRGYKRSRQAPDFQLRGGGQREGGFSQCHGGTAGCSWGGRGEYAHFIFVRFYPDILNIQIKKKEKCNQYH